MIGVNMKYLNMFLLVFSTIFSGCAINNHTHVPEDQFGFINKQANLSICDDKSGECVPAGPAGSVASGVLVAHKRDKSYYLTADHVCHALEDINLGFSGISVKAEDISIVVNLENGEKLKANIYASSNEYQEDLGKDLCLLETDRVKAKPIELARKEPRKWTKILNVAAPAGIWASDMMLHFHGEYQGDTNINTDDNPMMMAFYILDAQGGSSGSPIVNNQGKLVGILTISIIPSNAISAGPTYETTKKFLQHHLWQCTCDNH